MAPHIPQRSERPGGSRGAPRTAPDNQILIAQRAEALEYHSLWVFQRLLYAVAPQNDYPPLPGQP